MTTKRSYPSHEPMELSQLSYECQSSPSSVSDYQSSSSSASNYTVPPRLSQRQL